MQVRAAVAPPSPLPRTHPPIPPSQIHAPPHTHTQTQAAILAGAFSAFASEIAVASAEKDLIFSMLRICERVRICMLEAGGVISPATSPGMAADRNQLLDRVKEYQ